MKLFLYTITAWNIEKLKMVKFYLFFYPLDLGLMN